MTLRRYILEKPTTGVILLNMGGPSRLEDVRPFLYNLFSDREIIRLGPSFLQKPIAWMIARKRAPKSKANYARIGGRSPLAEITAAQSKALAEALQPCGSFHVTYAMRYWPPSADTAIRSLLKKGVNRFIGLTLYPHYSKATTGSSVRDLQQCLNHLAPQFPAEMILSWPTQPSYIQAVSENIVAGLARFGPAPAEIVYSAHSLPVSFIKEGDPYVEHIKQTIKAVETITDKKGHLCYQSRSGPVEWLTPSTPTMLAELAQQGCKNVLMVPISFVSDHIETLYEIKMEYRDLAESHGMKLLACDSLNTNALFIRGLRDLILENVEAGNLTLNNNADNES